MAEGTSDGSRRGAPARIAWPVVARAEEHRAVAVVSEHRWSVALVGAPGLGKTTVAARVVERVLEREQDAAPLVVPITAVAANASMPFGAVSDRFGDLPEITSVPGVEALVAEERLRRSAEIADRDLLIRVDDAGDLDDVSARYVAWLVRYQGARLVLTCRDFSTLAEPLRALWQDDLLERIELRPLDVRTTATLVREALGAPLESASVERVHRATEGNPLYLREVLRAALASGALEQTATGWYWRGRVTASHSLADMYRTELSDLPVDVRDVVDIVALAEPIPLSQLLALVDGADVDRAVALGLARIESLGPAAPVVRPAHPLVGEVLRALVPVSRRAELFARANAFRADHVAGAPPAARLRSTLWALECGVVPPVDQVLDAATTAGRLQEYESAIALTSVVLEGTPSPADRVAALCLRSVANGYSDGREAGRTDAEAAWALVLDAAPGSVPDAAVIEACETLANIRQFHDDDADAAVAMTDTAARLVGPDAAERLRLLRLGHLGWAGRFDEVRAEVERSGILHAPTVPRRFLVIAPCAVMALATAGRLDEAMQLGQACLATATASIEHAPWSVGEIASVLHQVQVWRGDIDDMITEVPVRRASPFLKYDFTLELIGAGNHALGQRRWADAVAAFTAACERYAVADHGGFAAYAWARLALAQAYAGEPDAAASSLERARTTPQRAMRITGDQIPMTIAWTESLLGNPAGVRRAEALIERATVSGAATHVMYGRALQYATDLAEGTGAGPSLDRMRTAAARVDGPLAGALVSYADAVRSRDRVRITTAQEVLAARGMAVAAGRLKQQLTKREYEVAHLASQGRSNRWIAEHLGLSVRTIDAHLSRVFSKWDLHARTELRDLV